MPPMRFVQLTTFRRPLQFAMLSSGACLAFMATAASADCTADASGTTVTCTGASTGYSNFSSGVSLSADSTATITGTVSLGNQAEVENGGVISSSTTSPLLQVGSGSNVVNNGSIELSTLNGGSAAVILGDDSTLTNDGTLTATGGTTVVQFGQAGTFINNSSAPAAVVGNILFGSNLSGGTSVLKNYNATFGIDGNIYSSGNTSIYNDGLISGTFVQTATGGNVAFENDTGGTFTGSMSIGDVANVVNLGNMTLSAASGIGNAQLGASSFTNSGTLTLGTTVPVELVVNGAFVNSASGILNIAIHSNGTAAPLAGTSYSQIYATGPNGTATLGGTLNLVPTAGFYPTGSTYNVILADQSITGSFATIKGNTLPFITFVPIGITTIGNQQAYEVMAVRPTSYAQAIAGVATPSEIAVAGGLDPLVAAANADPTSTAATLIGSIDLLTIPQTLTLLDQINPANYLAFGQALDDETSLFDRHVRLRTFDQGASFNASDGAGGTANPVSAGLWTDVSGQFHVGSTDPSDMTESDVSLSAGYDIAGRHWLLGGALGISSASLKTGNADLSGHNNAYIAGAYGALREGPFSITGQLDYDLGKLSAQKDLSLSYSTTTTAATATTAATTTTTATNTKVSASAGEHLLKATGTVGVDLKLADIEATPFVGMDYESGAVNGFTESGGNAADLTVARMSVNRTDVLGGVYLTQPSGSIRPYVRATYRSELGHGSNDSVSAYFDDDPSSTFTVNGPAFGRHELDVDGGLNVVTDDAVLFLGYEATVRKQMSDVGAHAGVRLSF